MLKKLSALVLSGAFLFAGSNAAMAYEVKAGDTMSKIAQTNGLSLSDLAAMNPQVSNLNLIYVGQTIHTNKNESKNDLKPLVAAESVKGATAHEIDLMARLVRAEAESEPYAGKVAVAVVVLNRVESSQFPNSIKEVIYQPGQFSPVSNGQINKPADAESVRAVKEALSSGQSSGAGSLFFYNPSTATSRWLDSRPTTVVIGNHVFKK
ncbi:cell wall hydrolase [Bacillus licheniformis]|uniref:cell wall hydrolase n=1 Tax=Bacillus licheniformis TaxID=1402 RepID=UPI00119D0073|nr:cell wall hydrolase [Bacillus licheniformis]